MCFHLSDFCFSFSELLKKMFCSFVLCCLCFWHLVEFVDSDAVKSVSVTEGDSVTLDSNLTGLQRQDQITWTFGHLQTRIAAINKEDEIFNTSGGDAVGFKDRLKLDQNGSLTITNSRTNDTGNYTVTIKRANNQTTYRFNVTVYGSGSQKALISLAIVGSVLTVAAVGIFCIYKKYRKPDQEGTDQARNDEITYAEPTFLKQKAQKPGVKQGEEVLYADVVTKN